MKLLSLASLRAVAAIVPLTALALGTAAAPAAAVDVKTITSPGGIKAWLVVDKTTPILTISFAFRGGALRDPKGKEGVAKMVQALLDQGSGTLDAQAVQRKLEDLSIRISFSGGSDDFTGTMRTLMDNRDVALDMFAEMLSKPRFDPAAVERVRRQMISAAIRSVKRPATIASRAWMTMAFPHGPYNRLSGGTPESLKAITVEDLRAFVKEAFARDNLVIGVVGNFDPKEVGPWLDRVFGTLPAKSAPLKVTKVAPVLSGSVKVIPFDVPQSQIIFGQKGLPRADKDYYAAFVMNHILGLGSFTSRLYQEVREKRGLAYGVYTYLYNLNYSDLYYGSTATTNSAAAETIAIIRREWERMAAGGATAEELAAAKKYLTGAYPLRFSESKGLAEMLVGVQLDDQGPDFFNKRNGYVEAVTLADIKRVAKRLLDEKHLTFVVVGSPKGL